MGRGSWGYQYARTLERTPVVERARQEQGEIKRSTGLLVPSLVVGGLTLVLSAAVEAVLG
jgi:hypothetical protein